LLSWTYPNAAPRELLAMGVNTLWTYGINDHVDKLPPLPADLKVSGNFRIDFVAACEKYGIVPHPAFSPHSEGEQKGQRKPSKTLEDGSRPDTGDGPTEGPILAVQTMLVDRAAMQVTSKLLVSSNRLEVLRFSSCRLDAEMLGLLREGLKDLCTVAALQIDWNPLEIPVDKDAVAKAQADGGAEEVNELERKRVQQQAQRTLQAFGEAMQVQCGEIEDAIRAVVKTMCEDNPDGEADLTMEPLDVAAWLQAFHKSLHFPADYVQQVFTLLDGPLFGGEGNGCVSLNRLHDVLLEVLICPPPSASEEAAGDKRKSTVAKPVAVEEVKDPIGDVFASFVDSTSLLELVSFRCCDLSRLETSVIARAIRGNLPNLPPSPHLRALNLWGNRICDNGVAPFAEALECHFGLQYLGLGKNLITHVGLQKLCRPLGFMRIDRKDEADAINKEIKEKAKERDKRAKAPPIAKKDARGRERYMLEFYMPSLEDRKDAETGETFWLYGRNMVLKTLNLEHNPVSDVATVLRVQSYGVGDLVLRKTKCAEELLDLKAKAEAEGDPNAWLQPIPGGLPGGGQGWNLVLQ